MKPVEFPQVNIIFKGADMDLPACATHHRDTEQPMIVSCWQLEEGDLEKIKETGVVWFALWGSQQPPICVSATSFFDMEERNVNEECSGI